MWYSQNHTRTHTHSNTVRARDRCGLSGTTIKQSERLHSLSNTAHRIVGRCVAMSGRGSPVCQGSVHTSRMPAGFNDQANPSDGLDRSRSRSLCTVALAASWSWHTDCDRFATNKKTTHRQTHTLTHTRVHVNGDQNTRRCKQRSIARTQSDTVWCFVGNKLSATGCDWWYDE